ncbi:hypothetical protein HNQ80_004494 [Anaerosolibacter carboniphilus]|uniref:Uncharacterized protein n=1 Tax=Anaerosolibacter carboniphilus TaxID=1417629 RepID=A0A841L2C9_9FIRM|nr:hypothetical protein [Anaerosolibacter carboniphilus]MBB6218330.1 hypothetical protein [Anaerosolibacter carboniphilus]
MSNLFWYILLAIIGVVITTYTLYMKKDIYKVSTLMVFFLFAAGGTWIGEFIVLGLFNSYAYKTGVFTDPWAQNLLGHLILNTTLYPAVAIVMVAYSLGYGWISFVTALFAILEYLFIKIGIYEHHWWKYYMTAIAIVIFLLICRYWFSKMNQKPHGLTRAFIFYFVAMVIVHIPAPILLLLGKVHYQIDFVNNYWDNFYLSSTIIIFFYHLIETFLLVIFVCILKNKIWKLAPFILSIVAQSVFAKMNILVLDAGWNLVYTILIYEIFILIFILLEKYSLRSKLNIFE